MFRLMSTDPAAPGAPRSTSLPALRERSAGGSTRRLLGLLGGRAAGRPTDPGPSTPPADSPRRGSDCSLRAGSPSQEAAEGRSYVGVLRRISSMLAQGGAREAAPEETKQHWLPDAVSRECYDCGDKFTTFRRRHHCRICGQIFCSRCCNQLIPGKVLGYSGDLRVCTYCSKVVMTYVQSITSDADAEQMLDLKQVLEKVQSHLETANSLSGERSSSLPRVGKHARKKYSLGMQDGALEQSQESITDPLEEEQDLTYLTTLLQMITNPIHGVGLGNHRHRLKSYGQSLIGSELVDWLVSQRKVTRRAQAVALGQRLVDMKLLVCVSHNTAAFRDQYCLYRPSSQAMQHQRAAEPDEPDLEEPHWLSQIELKEDLSSGAATDEPMSDSTAPLRLAHSGSMYDIELDVAASVVSISRAQLIRQLVPGGEHATPPPAGLAQTPAQYLDSGAAEADPRRPVVDERCAAAFEALESALLGQLLDSAGLPAKWYGPLLELSRQLSRLVKPDVRHECDELDVRQYVKIKRIPGGKPSDSTIVHGIVCHKNIVHNEMRSHVTNPQILLLNCAVSYQRVQDRMVSLEPMLMQERDVLRNITSLLISFAPDVIVVEKHVECIARQLLLEAGVTLVTNVKKQVLARIARCTQADLMGYVDVQLTKPALGICHTFYTKSFTMEGGHKKTLMFFEGCPSHLGCTVLLRGGHMNQLRRVKHVLRFMVSVQYNWLLQRSFLRDLAAAPPPFGQAALPLGIGSETPATAERETPPPSECAGKEPTGTLPAVAVRVEPRACEEGVRSPRRCGEVVTDRSDPLHAVPTTQPEAGIVRPRGLRLQPLPDRARFRRLLGDTVVCCTPYAKVSLPYLETEAGKQSGLRRFFAADLYWSVEFDKAEKARRAQLRKAPIESRPEPPLLPPHPFTGHSFTEGLDATDTQSLLADFRARGGRCPKLPPQAERPPDPVPDRLEDWVAPHDALSPINHQKLALQTYTYAKLPSGAALGCCDPHIMVIMFNGDSDTTLGTFLENECFSPTFKCLKKECVVPQQGHVQRFLHDSGCISMSVTELAEPCPDKKTWMWTWCQQCDRGSSARPMTEDTWTLSFGKFLETLFLCDQYTSLDGCEHSLFRDRSHYFALESRVAVFTHTVIQLNDIVLPQFDISVELGSLTQLRLTEELHTLSEGVQLFSNIIERLVSMKAACSDARISEELRLSLEEVAEEKTTFRTLLTAIETMLAPLVGHAAAAEGEDLALDETQVFAATDRAVQAKRMMADTVHKWNARVLELGRSVKAVPKPKADESEPERSHKRHSSSSESPRPGVEGSPGRRAEGAKYFGEDDSTESNVDADSTDKPSSSKVKSITAGGIKALKSLAWSSTEFCERFVSPLPVNEHHRLPATLPPSFICGDDIGSIIAYCMLTGEYGRRLAEIRHQMETRTAEEPTLDSSTSEASGASGGGARRGGSRGQRHPSDNTVASDSSVTGSDRSDGRGTAAERGEKYLAQYHIDINMSDDNANFYCQVLLAEHFRRLRDAVFSAGEERFVRCLMRCKPWNAKGGKSGSTFQKSSDDRFVIKTISKIEKDHFVRFGVRYVDYVLESLTKGRPSVLAKIFGVFLVGYKNNITGQAKKSYVIVMENLLYGRRTSQKFDLKGSLRNRLADTKDKSEVVLLDQNMVTLLSENPLYVRPHAKRLLMEAISRDTSFLQLCQVMDYSLLVGMDEQRRCLVVGIIDYLRSYTYDKAVETYIKSYNILLGDGNNRPTVLDPVRYKTRFADMMNKYFTDVPDRWLGFAQGAGCLC